MGDILSELKASVERLERTTYDTKRFQRDLKDQGEKIRKLGCRIRENRVAHLTIPVKRTGAAGPQHDIQAESPGSLRLNS